MDRHVTIEDLLRNKGDKLQLELLSAEGTLARTLSDPDVSSPGLALAGYTERFAEGRIQILGQTEISYLRTLELPLLEERIRVFFQQDMPAVIITKGQEPPPFLLETGAEAGVAILRTAVTTKELYRRIKPFLEDALSARTVLHGSLADVYGVGLLFVGKSGIGKSECVLDLVERGHRLVADDLVMTTRQGNDLLIGKGHEMQRHNMEIRGVGIVDIRLLFGIRAIRQQKRIEVVVQLEQWQDDGHYDRTGLDGEQVEILGVSLPKVTIPLNPGKNITVVSEVVAMNHLLKYTGIDSAAIFDRNLKEAMRPVREYLEEDYE